MQSAGESRGGRRWGLGLLAFGTWALAAASAVAWALKFSASPAIPAQARLAVGAPAAVGASTEAVGRLLGAAHAAAAPGQAAPASSQFVLQGVAAAAGRSDSAGAAVIAVDGKVGRSFRIGAEVAPGIVLHQVEPRAAVLADARTGAVLQRLELPVRR